MVDRRIAIYISGPMTGLPDYNYPAFHDAAKRLRSMGYFVFNPAESFAGDTSRNRADYMRKDIEMLLKSDVVALLDGWEKSKGARLEVSIAIALELTLHPYEVLAV